MKKTILMGLVIMSALKLNAQTITIDLNTGIYPPGNPNGVDIPAGSLDDTWMVKIPGTNVYNYAFVTTGREPSIMNQNPNETYQDIDAWSHVVGPYMWDSSDSLFGTVTAVHGDLRLVPSGVNGTFIYRMQFNFSKTCSTVVAARINIDNPATSGTPYGIFTGNGITGIKLNGHNGSLPGYSPTDYLSIDNAHQQAPMSTTWPFNSPIPSRTITLNPSYFNDGTNSIFILVDPSTQAGLQTGALMINANLEIDYVPVGTNNLLFDMTGSTSSICNGQSAAINVGINPPATTGTISVNNTFIGNAPSASTTVSPSVSTTYAVTLTQSNGCVTKLNWPVTVQYPPIPNLTGSTSLICIGQGTIPQISVGLNTGNPSNYQLDIIDVTNGNTNIYSGSVNMSIAINPTSYNLYQIIIKDLVTGCERVTDFPVYFTTPPFCDSPFRVYSDVEIDDSNEDFFLVRGKSLNAAEEYAHPGFMSTWSVQELDANDYSSLYGVAADCWNTEAGVGIDFPGFDAVDNTYEYGSDLDCTAPLYGRFLYGRTYLISRKIWADDMEPVFEGMVVYVDETMAKLKPEGDISAGDVALSIYPNPTNGNVIIQYEVENGSDVKVVLTDVTGRSIKAARLSSAGNTANLDLSGNDSGIYFVNVYKNGQLIKTEKLLLNH